jgi:hypothetical protein
MKKLVATYEFAAYVEFAYTYAQVIEQNSIVYYKN